MDIIEVNKSNIKRHPWELARFEIILELITNVLPPSEKIKTILDIGCGDCYLAVQLLGRRADIEIIGIDTAYSPDEANEKNKEINNQRFSLFQTLADAKNHLSGKDVECVLLLDVIEHIEDDHFFLQSLATSTIINNETRVLISVPAFQSLFTEHDIFLRHFRRYNKKTLQKTISSAGFIPLTFGYFFSSLLPVRLFRKFREKAGIKKVSRGIGEWNKSKFLTNLFRNYLLFDYKFSRILNKTGIRLPGLSLYCLCKKSVL